MATTMASRVIVIPGDTVTEQVITEVSGNISGKAALGPGLRQDGEQIFATKAGILRLKKPNTFWVDCHQKRYIPAKGDMVLGVVTQKAGDIFRVDIGSSSQANLSYLAFEGATKRNRPNVQVGDVVYAKLLVANRDMEPELVCIDSTGRSQGLGVVGSEGFMFQCSLGLVRRCLSQDWPMLTLLGTKIKYEISVGMNGRIFVQSTSVKNTIAIFNAISNSEFMTDEQMRTMVERLALSLSVR